MKDARALQVNTAAAPMASPTHKDHNSKDARKFQLHRKRLVVLRKMEALAVITRSNTFSIWSMVVARDSGTAAVEAMAIDTIQLKSANRRAKHQPEKMHVFCRKFMDLAVATIRSIITILIGMHVRNSFMADVWATQIDLKLSMSVKNSAKSTNRCVS